MIKGKFFGLGILLGFILLGCGKDSKQCAVSKPEKTINLVIAQKEAIFDVWTGATRDNSDMRFSFMRSSTSFDSREIINAINFYRIPSSKDQLFKMVLLADINPGELNNDSLSPNNINGIITYTLTENEDLLELRVYEQSANKSYSEIRKLRSKVNSTTTNQYHDIASIFYTRANHISAIVIFENSKIFKMPGKKSAGNFSHNYADFLNLNLHEKKTRQRIDQLEHGGGGVACSEPCYALQGSCIEYIGGDVCEAEERRCSKGDMDQINNPQLSSVQQYSISSENPILYRFRDGILSNSTTGRHLASDYYYISSIISSKITIDQAIEAYRLLKNNVIPMINLLLDSPNSSQVLYNSTKRDELKAFVNDLRQHSTDMTYQAMLDEINLNLDAEANKTVASVSADLIN